MCHTHDKDMVKVVAILDPWNPELSMREHTSLIIDLRNCARKCNLKRGRYPQTFHSLTTVNFNSEVTMAVVWTEPESKSETMFRSNLEDIKSRFATLLRSVQSALEANYVTIEDVYAVLVGMLNCGDDIPKTNLDDIFSSVTSLGLWDHIYIIAQSRN